MAGGVNQVQVIDLTIFGLVLQRSSLRLDGDAPLFFDVHRVKHLGLHLALLQAAAALDQAVGQGGFAMVNVRDDGKVSDVVHQQKASSGGVTKARTRKKGASNGDAP